MGNVITGAEPEAEKKEKMVFRAREDIYVIEAKNKKGIEETNSSLTPVVPVPVREMDCSAALQLLLLFSLSPDNTHCPILSSALGGKWKL